MATMDDFLRSVRDKGSTALNWALERGESAMDKGSKWMNSLRSGETTLGYEAGKGARAAGEAVGEGVKAAQQSAQEFKAGMRGQPLNTGADSVFGQKFQEELRASNERVRSMGNPGTEDIRARGAERARTFFQGAPGQSTQNIQGSRSVGESAAREYLGGDGGGPGKPGFLRRTGAVLGKMAGPVGAAVEGASLVSDLADPNTEGWAPRTTRALLRGGGAVLGGAAGTAMANLPGGLAGGYAGYKAGDAMASFLVGPEKQPSGPGKLSAAAGEPAAPRVPGRLEGDAILRVPGTTGGGSPPMPPAVTQEEGDKYSKDNPPKSLAGVMPSDLRSGAGFVQTGRGPIRGFQSAPQAPTVGVAAEEYDRMRGFTRPQEIKRPEGVFGEMAMGASLRSQDVAARRAQAQANVNEERRMKGAEAMTASADRRYATDTAADTARSRLLYDASVKAAELKRQGYQDAEKAADDRVKDYVAASLPPLSAVDAALPGAKERRAADAERVAGTFKGMLAHTYKGKIGDVPADKLQGHFLDFDMRNRAQQARGTWKKEIADYSGIKQMDSRNLVDWQPSHIEKSKMPTVSYWVVLKSGEKVPITSTMGGGWNLLGANDPIDKNMLRRVLESHRQAVKSTGGKLPANWVDPKDL